MDDKRGISWFKWIFILLVVGGAAWVAWWYYSKPKSSAPQYRTAPAVRGDILQTVTASGQINPMANVQVGSQISGIIKQLYADYNSSVTQGQVIAEIDPATYRAVLLQSEAELATANAALELTKLDARRAAQLREGKLVAEAEYDKAIAELHQAEAQVKLREAALERARVDLSRCTISAPTNGIVISRAVDVGQTVAASLQAPTLFIIANDLRRMQIDAMVSEADIGGVETNQNVTFTVEAFPNRQFTGKVIQIRNAPTTNQNVVAYDTVIEVNNADMKLKPGMTATVSILVAEHRDVVRVPNSALRFRPPETNETARATSMAAAPREGAGGGAGSGGGGGGRRMGGGGAGGPRGQGGGGPPRGERNPVRNVYVVASTNDAAMKLEQKRVRAGITDGIYTEILEGLNEGDLVVTGLNSAEPSRGPSGAPANPFGGGGRRF
jgi:HlyD family secretion protein